MNNEEEELKRLENEIKKLDNMDYGSPEPERKDNLFKFFREILFLKNTTRVGNIDATELGSTKLGVRPLLEVSRYADAEGLDKVAEYLVNKAEIITSTSMSKKGFWAKLFVTQIKSEQKTTPKEPTKKKWFSFKKNEEEGIPE